MIRINPLIYQSSKICKTSMRRMSFVSDPIFYLKSIVSDVGIAVLAVFCFLFAWNIFSYLFIFNLFMCFLWSKVESLVDSVLVGFLFLKNSFS